MAGRLHIDRAKIEAFCRKWKIRELSLFGSVLREDFRADSDVDVLVTYCDDAEWTLLDEVRIEQELSALLGRGVDLVSKWAVEHSDNWIRRNAILGSAEVVYES